MITLVMYHKNNEDTNQLYPYNSYPRALVVGDYINIENDLSKQLGYVPELKFMLLDTSEYLSDGYHNMDELYLHRHELYLALISSCENSSKYEIIFSKYHHDGTFFDDMILVQIINCENDEQISYHIPDKYRLRLLSMSHVQEVSKCKAWDGHTSNDVLNRLQTWFK